MYFLALNVVLEDTQIQIINIRFLLKKWGIYWNYEQQVEGEIVFSPLSFDISDSWQIIYWPGVKISFNSFSNKESAAILWEISKN